MRVSIAAIALFLSGCASALSGGDDAPLGTQQNAVRVDTLAGERAYLARLRCSDGSAPSHQRLGNGGGSIDGHILAIYVVRCAAGEPRASEVWMDMHHPGHAEAAAPPGFTLVAP
ncbi:MAG: hypothetical protein ACREH4_13410 [Vitreimonas sp.]